MSVTVQVYVDPEEADARLRSLGLSLAIVHEAMTAAEIARSSCSALSPRWYPGSAASAHATISLREQLVPVGWRACEDGGYSTTVSPANIALVVATGDEATGMASRCAGTKYPKGPATIQAVVQNVTQLELGIYDAGGIVVGPTQTTAAPTTWMLLIARADAEVRGEVSLPAGIDDDGRVIVWQERILLPPLPLDRDPDLVIAPPPGPEFDVNVVPRVS